MNFERKKRHYIFWYNPAGTSPLHMMFAYQTLSKLILPNPLLHRSFYIEKCHTFLVVRNVTLYYMDLIYIYW